MKMKYKKLVVAIQSATMTSLICSALPSYASDIELYKSPQASQTTLMFMLDVSGSMSDRNSYDGTSETRLIRLKNGMIRLLQGDANTEPLPDRLIVGLSDFDGNTGRIKLEAESLGTTTTLAGTRPVFQTVQTYTQPASSTVEQSKTSSTTQTKEETGTRAKTCKSTNGTVTGGSKWCNVSTVSNWSLSQDWSPDASASSGSWSPTAPDWGLTGVRTASNTATPQECIDWNIDGTACTYWESTLKTVNDFGSVTPTETYGTPNYSAASAITYSPSSTGTTSTQYGQESDWNEWCNNNNKNCTRTKTRTATVISTRTVSQTSTATYTVTTTYYGTAKETHRKKMLRAVKALRGGSYTPTAFAYAEVAAYLMGQTTKGYTSSGFNDSTGKTLIQDGTKYIAPSSVNSSKQCNTQGIYFLTDGEPNYNNNPGNYTTFMKDTLGTAKTSFSCSTNQLVSTGNSWGCIGNYAKALLDSSKNPAGVAIKTAVVGFGSDFNDGMTGDSNVENAKKWGEVGQGGWYSGASAADVVNSVNAFLKKMQKYIPPVTTGSVTIPVDNLDTQNVQPWGYFPQFDPQPDSKVTTWIGNLKKYEVVNNVLLDRDGKNIIDATTKLSVDDPNDFWADESIKKTIVKIKRVGTADIEEEVVVRVGGALSQFNLGMTDNKERKIFTDRKINEQDLTASNISGDSNLVQIKTADLKVLNDANNFAKDPKRGYIASLFGYDIGSTMASSLETDSTTETQTNFANFLTNSNAKLRQMGAVMHSKPVLITQSGTTTYNDKTGDLTYTDRDDLIVFGTTQGLLQVVRAGKTASDPDAGKEVFTFVPNEMVENQYQGFLNQNQQGSILKYGIDGQWTAYTEYATRSGTNPAEPVVSVKDGKQWLYGGLRMGGNSYYALDLSKVTSDGGTPKLKFRIDPKSALAYSPLSYMGQSWSKPTLTWVNWKGTRKLVMIVGGGYDTAYESLAFNPSSSIDKGAGVYMFDADNGSLLWWSSANVSSSSKLNTETYAANMKRSVVSQIKAVDRNNDGLADHLYFGDLGGQVWRVDINASNKAGDTENFAKRAVRILDMSSAANVPRFYTTPTFTVHSSVNGYFGVVTIGSGNLSFPMSAANQNDALYVIYDKDVAKRNLSVLEDSELSTVDISPSGLNGKKLVANSDGNTEVPLTSGGWYYPLASKNRILNDNVAIDSDLYISVFDSTIDIDDVDCVGGVRGKSVAKQFCLPFGQCLKKDSSGNNVSDNRPEDIELGRGNIGISFGGIDKKRGLVLNLPTDKTLKSYQGKTKFISQRWYER